MPIRLKTLLSCCIACTLYIIWCIYHSLELQVPLLSHQLIQPLPSFTFNQGMHLGYGASYYVHAAILYFIFYTSTHLSNVTPSISACHIIFHICFYLYAVPTVVEVLSRGRVIGTGEMISTG